MHYREYKPELYRRYKGCQACGEDMYAALVIHHRHYRTYGYEEFKDLALLCWHCHNLLHSFCKGSDPDLERITRLFIKTKGMMWSKQK